MRPPDPGSEGRAKPGDGRRRDTGRQRDIKTGRRLRCHGDGRKKNGPAVLSPVGRRVAATKEERKGFLARDHTRMVRTDVVQSERGWHTRLHGKESAPRGKTARGSGNGSRRGSRRGEAVPALSSATRRGRSGRERAVVAPQQRGLADSSEERSPAMVHWIPKREEGRRPRRELL
ncbi:hypothetical protein E2562_037479 [Oryza meyeriana var. granulata]|uniref:Uncharacterized protein n=1 Tax=Oryza meyeriana var. granulata TaxID=110450 RepID=A0A6G1DT83_9ORYZ|nr:hypothetical protein E2562_037479 [Oryza meyeriana var. granulata]